MKYIGIIALVGLTACTFSPENMFYEVTQSNKNGVVIQANKGNMNMQSPEVAQMMTYMDGMAIQECQGLSKTSANFTNQRVSTAGPYYSWIERTYKCR